MSVSLLSRLQMGYERLQSNYVDARDYRGYCGDDSTGSIAGTIRFLQKKFNFFLVGVRQFVAVLSRARSRFSVQEWSGKGFLCYYFLLLVLGFVPSISEFVCPILIISIHNL